MAKYGLKSNKMQSRVNKTVANFGRGAMNTSMKTVNSCPPNLGVTRVNCHFKRGGVSKDKANKKGGKRGRAGRERERERERGEHEELLRNTNDKIEIDETNACSRAKEVEHALFAERPGS